MNKLYPGENYRNRYSYTYRYDKKGNWVQRIEYLNDKPAYIVTREIQYHRGFDWHLPFGVQYHKGHAEKTAAEGIGEGL